MHFLPRSFRPPVAALLLSAILACQGGEAAQGDSVVAHAPGDAAREFAITIDRLRPQLSVKEWKSALDDGTATLTAYASGDTLRLVREVHTHGERGREASRYYYDGAQLRYFESDADVSGGQPPQSRKERLVLAFDLRRVVVEVSHQLDGATAPVDSMRIREVVTRAAEVARQWATTAPAAAR